MIKKSMTVLSTLVWVLLPKCSLCLAAYMGIFSSLGLGNIMYNKNTILFVSIFLLMNFCAFMYMLIKEKEYQYAAISFISAIVFAINKFYFYNNLYVNIIVTSFLIFAMIRIRILKISSKTCVFHS